MTTITKTYWGGRGRHQALASELNKRIPATGEVENPRKNPALERFRKASNLYHEIFNNGCINYARGAKDFFGIDASHLRLFCRERMWDHIHIYTEPAMDEIVMAAAVEQGLVQPKSEGLAFFESLSEEAKELLFSRVRDGIADMSIEELTMEAIENSAAEDLRQTLEYLDEHA